jgi:hypothetical protein
LVSPVAIGTPTAARRRASGDDAPGVSIAGFLEDQAREGRVAGRRTWRGRDRAVHGERADVAAGKKERTDDVGVGREGEPRPSHGQHRTVVQRREQRIGEARYEELVDQLLGHPAAAAVRHLHGRVVGDRQRTDRAVGQPGDRFVAQRASLP